MKNNKIMVSALALALGLGAVAPTVDSYAADTNLETANVKSEGKGLVENLKRLSNGNKAVALTEEEEKYAKIFDNLSDKDKAEVIKSINATLANEGYSLAKNSKGEYVVVSRTEGFDLRTEAQEYAEGLDEAKGKQVKYIELEDGKYTYVIFPEGELDLEYNLDAYKGLIDLDSVVNDTKERQSDVVLYEKEEEAKEAAEKALEENDAFELYNLFEDEETGKFYYILSNEDLDGEKEDPVEQEEEGYATKEEAEKAADEALKANDSFKSYEVYEDEETGRWFFTLKGAEVTEEDEDPVEEEGYATKEEAEKAAKEALDKNSSFKGYDVYEDEETGRWFFTLKGTVQTDDTKPSKDDDEDEKPSNDKDKTDDEDKKPSEDDEDKQPSKGDDKDKTSTGTADSTSGTSTTGGGSTTTTSTVTPVAVNKENLNKAIVDAEILIKDGKGTKEQRETLQRAIDNARIVRDKANVTQSELDREEKAIRDIMNDILGVNKQTENSAVASESSVKTGVAGVSGIAGVLAATTAGYALNKKRK
jgi:albumin-binding protein